MKRLSILFFLLLFAFPTTTFAERGIIAFCNDRDGVIVIGTNNGYTCGTSYFVPFGVERGNYVVGTLSSYGTHEIYDLDADVSFQLWIDEFWLSKNQAIEWLQRQ